MPDNKIFVSYRRQDASGEAGRLVDNLQEVFGDDAVFLDVETLEAGLDFVEAIDQALNSCKVLIAIIGPHWADIKDSEGNLRLFEEGDFIRIEIAAALERKIRVIPVLVNRAKMPTDSALPEELKALNRRHAHELSSSRWKYDTDQLIEVLAKFIPKKKADPSPIKPRPQMPKTAPVKKQNSGIARNIAWFLGGIVFLIFIALLIPDDEIDTNGGNQGSEQVLFDQEENQSSDVLDNSGSSESNQPINPTPPQQEEEYFTVDMTGGWSLSLNGEVVSFLRMDQVGDDVAFIEYNLFDTEVGSGSGFWEEGVLYLDYYNSLMGISGEMEFQGINQNNLSGQFYVPANNSNSQISLGRVD